jgi:hypothetical protein
MAISAAAAAPNMGAMTMKQFVCIMTLLNVRLGYWTPNPLKINRVQKLSRWRWPGVGPRYLLKEAFGNLNAKKSYILKPIIGKIRPFPIRPPPISFSMKRNLSAIALLASILLRAR